MLISKFVTIYLISCLRREKLHLCKSILENRNKGNYLKKRREIIVVLFFNFFYALIKLLKAEFPYIDRENRLLKNEDNCNDSCPL